MKRIAIFATGEGTNAEALAQHFAGSERAEIAFMAYNRKTAGVPHRMERYGIPSHYFPKEEWIDGANVLTLLRSERIDLIVLAGFLAIIPKAILDAYEGRIVNIHPSLLTRHGGKGMWGMHVHRAVLDAGDKESGITIHYVSNEIDGGEIIFQASCEVKADDTAESLAHRVHQLEYQHFPHIIDQILTD